MSQIKDLQKDDTFAGLTVISNELIQNGANDEYILTLSGTLTDIKQNYFDDNEALKSIKIPESINSIDSDTFDNLKNLTSIDMSAISNIDSAKSLSSKINLDVNIILPDNTIQVRHKYNEITIAEENKKIFEDYITDYTKQYDKTNIAENNTIVYKTTDNTELTLTNSNISTHNFDTINNIGTIILTDITNTSELFKNQNTLKEVYIGEGFTILGSWMFGNETASSSSLDTIVLPSTITEIGSYCFKECSNISSIYLPNNVTTLNEYSFYGCDKLQCVRMSNNITIIPEHCFGACPNLQYINMPSSLTIIKTMAFYACFNIGYYISYKSLTQPEPFDHLYLLEIKTSLEMPDTLTEIEDLAFSKASVNIINFGNTRESMPTIHEHSFAYEENGIWKVYLSANGISIIDIDNPDYTSVINNMLIIPDNLYNDFINNYSEHPIRGFINTTSDYTQVLSDGRTITGKCTNICIFKYSEARTSYGQYRLESIAVPDKDGNLPA